MKNMPELYEQCLDCLQTKSEIKLSLTTPEAAISEESFECRFAKGIFHVQASSYSSAIFGINQAHTAIKSGHIAEYLGKWTPRFNLRPLWIHSSKHLQISEAVSVALPAFLFSPDHFKSFCQRVLELGYNSVILGKREPVIEKAECLKNISLQDVCDAFHHYGLKLILKPMIHCSHLNSFPLNLEYHEFLQRELKAFMHDASFDYLFWESEFTRPLSSRQPAILDRTQADLARTEAALIESCLPNSTKLIFYIPCLETSMAEEQASWLSGFCDDVGDHTIVAFPAVSGDPGKDYLPPHPFWEQLRQSPDVSATPLMPIINVGATNHGEGLWPVLTHDLVDDYFSRCQRHAFAGVISLVNHLPQKGALLDCNLWTASQMSWKERPLYPLVETWFSAYRPDLDYKKYANPLKAARELTKELGLIRSLYQEKQRDHFSSTECKKIGERLLSTLKYLDHTFILSQKKTHKKSQFPDWNDYFTYFIADAHRMVADFLHCMRIPSMQLKQDYLVNPGFWTELSMGSKVIFNEIPSKGQNGTSMNLIHQLERSLM